jgi:superfamily II DNA/RNA helicase
MLDAAITHETTDDDAASVGTTAVDIPAPRSAPDDAWVDDNDAANDRDVDDDIEELDDAADDVDTSGQRPFAELGLPAELVEELTRRGLAMAFAVQAAAIPDALNGRDILAKARTGSGKTLAFGLPVVACLAGRRARRRQPLALVLVPTRELAMQVADAIRPYAASVDLEVAAVFGGAAMQRQIDALRYGVEILVATPGRLDDLIRREACSLASVEVCVLDEADEMADMGFLPHVRALLDQTPAGGQRLLFSATLDGAVDEIVANYLNDPARHAIETPASDVASMTHHMLVVEPRDKATIVAQIAARHHMGDASRTLLFVRTKLAVDRVVGQLQDAGLAVAGLHGGMTQRVRTRTLAEFKEGRRPVLVATDVAARGIHVDGIDLVVHIDPTHDPKDYLHRAGRTARAGESGTVATLVLPKQRKSTARLLADAGVEASSVRVKPGHEALTAITGARSVASFVAEREVWDEEQRRRAEAERASRGGDRGRGRRFSRDDRERPVSARPRRFGDHDRPEGERRADEGRRYDRDRRHERERQFDDRRRDGDHAPRTERPARPRYERLDRIERADRAERSRFGRAEGRGYGERRGAGSWDNTPREGYRSRFGDDRDRRDGDHRDRSQSGERQGRFDGGERRDHRQGSGRPDSSSDRRPYSGRSTHDNEGRGDTGARFTRSGEASDRRDARGYGARGGAYGARSGGRDGWRPARERSDHRRDDRW